MGTLLICLLAVTSGAGERAAKASSAMAARRASVQPSAMAARRDARAAARSGVGRAAPDPAPGAAPVVPSAPAAPDFQARITPPTGSPPTGVDLRRHPGVAYAAPAPAAPEAPPAAIGGDGTVGAGPERAPAGVKGAAVTELKAGRTDRQFGGASDPVLFLVGGTGPSGSVTSSSDGTNLSISLGGQQR